MNSWRIVLGRLPSLIWFRLTVYTLVALLVALVAGIVGPLLPELSAVNLGQDSVSSILQILATSMLAVTTFSLTAMISAYSSAAAVATPRATQLLIADRTSQNALSSYLGAFVFSIVGIVALSTDYYGSQGRTILFFATLTVIGIIVVTLLRWIAHLTSFGRVADIIDRVEDAATDIARAYARHPHLRARPRGEVPDGAPAVTATEPGVVTALDVSRLDALAREHATTIHVTAMPGDAVDVDRALAHLDAPVPDEVANEIRAAFLVERHRTFEQDPRLGFVALAEVGSRALSPGVNDQGTAIEVLNALQRVMSVVLTTPSESAITFERVTVPRISVHQLADDAFRPLARDGAAIVEVGLRLQHVLGALARLADDPEPFLAASTHARARAELALTHPSDRAAVAAAADGVAAA